jgi:hypothetical protein
MYRRAHSLSKALEEARTMREQADRAWLVSHSFFRAKDKARENMINLDRRIHSLSARHARAGE